MSLPDFSLYCICDRLTKETVNTILLSVLANPSYIMFDSNLFHYELNGVHVASSSLDDVLRVKARVLGCDVALKIFTMDIVLANHPCCNTILVALCPGQRVDISIPRNFLLVDIQDENLTPDLRYTLHFYKASNDEEGYYLNQARRLLLFPPRLNRSPIPSRSLIGQTLRFSLGSVQCRNLPLMTTQKVEWESSLDSLLSNVRDIQASIERLRNNAFDRHVIVSCADQKASLHFITSFDMKLNCVVSMCSADIIDVARDIAACAILTHLMSHLTSLSPGELVLNVSDLHVVSVESLQQLVTKTPRAFPALVVDSQSSSKRSWLGVAIDVREYYPRP